MENIGPKEPLEPHEPLLPRRTLFDALDLPENWEDLPPDTSMFTAHDHCDITLTENAVPLDRLIRRAQERGLTPDEVTVTVFSPDDPRGSILADILMPGHDWQQYRDEGLRPVGRGLAMREDIQGLLDEIDLEAAERLRGATGMTEPPIIVVDHGVVEVYDPIVLHPGSPEQFPPTSPPDVP